MKKRMIDESDEIQKVVNKYYANRQVDFIPNYPYVLVRRLSRPESIGSIIVSDHAKNPIHEGIVLATYRPFYRSYFTTDSNNEMVGQDMNMLFVPPVQPGDHICYQHFEGVPVEHAIFGQPYYKSQNYLLVNCEVSDGRRGILAVIESTKESTRQKLINTIGSISATEVDFEGDDLVEKIVDSIMDRFVVSHVDEKARVRSARELKETQR